MRANVLENSVNLYHVVNGSRVQYAAEAYRSALATSGITPSMSRKGRTLSLDEINNVINVSNVLAFTITQMATIDAAYRHAFRT